MQYWAEKRASCSVPTRGAVADLLGRAVAAEVDGLDVLGAEAVLRPKAAHGVEAGEDVAAAAMVLEGHGGDGEALVETRERLVPLAGVLAGRGGEAHRAVQDIEGAGDAGGGADRGERAGVRRVAGVERLAHAGGAEGLLEPAGEGGGGGDGVRGALGVAAEEERGGRGGAEGADGAGGVPVAVVARLHGDADAAGHLVAGGDGAEQRVQRRAAGLRRGQRRADGGAAGVVAGIPEDVVELDRVAGGGVEQGGVAERAGLAVDVADGAAGAALGRHGGGEQGRGRVEAAGEEGGEPVDQRPARVVRDLGRQRPVAPGGGVLGEGEERVRRLACAARATRCRAAPPC